MATVIIVLILIIVFIMAVSSSLKHFRGKGGCCGGSSVSRAKRKKLKGTILGTWVIFIDGMSCKNCQNRVESRLNAIDGVIAKVRLKKKMAVVSFDRVIGEEELEMAITRAGYRMGRIQKEGEKCF